MLKFTKIFIIGSSLLASAPALSVGLEVEEIVRRVDERQTPKSTIMSLTMELIDNRDNVRVRKMRSFSREMGAYDAMSMRFDEPFNVKGTVYLTHDYDERGKTDDSWLYLPALRRAKRVSGGGEADSFMGSDFSYADINGINVEDWVYTMEKESEEVDGFDCWVLSAQPVESIKEEVLNDTGYNHRKIWVRKDNYYVVQGVYSVERNNRIKYMKAEGVHQVGGYWMAKVIRMISTKDTSKLHESRIHFRDIEVDIDIDEAFLAEAYLGKELAQQ